MGITEDELLETFGKKLIEKSRDLSIHEEFKIVEGSAKSPTSKSLYAKLRNFTPEQIEVIKEIIIDSVDGTLNNFLWLLEQDDNIDLISFRESQAVSLKNLSDGLSVDYWNFVNSFSKFKRVE